MSTLLGGKCITLYISADHRRFRSKLRVLNNWRWCRGWRQGLVGLHTSDTGTAGVEGAGGTGGPGRGAGGWRQGQGGPRDRPLRAAGSRVAISRAGRRPPAHTAARPIKASHAAVGTPAGGPPPTGTSSSPAPQPGPTAPATPVGPQATSTHTKTPTRNRVGVSEPPVGIEPTTYSLRVNRSAD